MSLSFITLTIRCGFCLWGVTSKIKAKYSKCLPVMHVQLGSSMAGSLTSPGWARGKPIFGGFWDKPEPLLHFTAPKRCWEQNVGDRPQQVVHTCRGEWRAEHHDDSWRKIDKTIEQITTYRTRICIHTSGAVRLSIDITVLWANMLTMRMLTITRWNAFHSYLSLDCK